MPNFFAPISGRFGTVPVPMNSGRINTGTLAAGTQLHNIGAFAAKSLINRATVCAELYPSATSCVVTLVKMTGVTALTLTSDLNINAATANVPLQFAFLSTLTEANRTLNAGDSLRVSIVAVGAVTVQPDDVTVTVELLVLA